MPLYVFESEDGERIERYVPMSEIRPTYEEGGKTYRRVYIPVAIVTDPGGMGRKFEDPRHRQAAIEEAKRAGEAVKSDPSAYPVTIGGKEGRTPGFVREAFDDARK